MSLVTTEESAFETRSGYVNTPWTVAHVTQGGFSLGLIIQAAMDVQRETSQPDMIHISALFHKNVRTGPYEVRVRKTKHGKGMSYFDADLMQKGSVCIASRCIFGILPDLTQVPGNKSVTIHQTSPLARRIPLITHPADAQHSFVDLTCDLPVQLAEERTFIEKNVQRASQRGAGMSLQSATGEHMGGTEWAAWCELSDYPGFDTAISPFNLAIIGDISVRPCYLLPESQRPPPSWPATIVLDLEFKSKIPKSDEFAQKTVGIYSTGKYMVEGQHDLCIEVWTAPCGVSEGVEMKDPNWRDKQICLAVSHQMVMVIPENLREKHAKTKSRKQGQGQARL